MYEYTVRVCLFHNNLPASRRQRCDCGSLHSRWFQPRLYPRLRARDSPAALQRVHGTGCRDPSCSCRSSARRGTPLRCAYGAAKISKWTKLWYCTYQERVMLCTTPLYSHFSIYSYSIRVPVVFTGYVIWMANWSTRGSGVWESSVSAFLLQALFPVPKAGAVPSASLLTWTARCTRTRRWPPATASDTSRSLPTRFLHRV